MTDTLNTWQPATVGTEAHVLTIVIDGEPSPRGLYSTHAAARNALLAYVIEEREKDENASALDTSTPEAITAAINAHFESVFEIWYVDSYLVEG